MASIKQRILTIIPIITVLMSPIFISSCSTNPATGETIFSGLVSEEQELKIGIQEHQKIIKQFGVINNPKLENYVQGIFKKITPYSERDIKYTLTILDSPVVNAFAVPGGYIYITRGLLGLANTEGQVAGVLAHEMAHITARHTAQQISHSTLTNLGAGLLGVITGNSAVRDAASLGSELFTKGYSRTHEYEADTLGLRYMSKAGYNVKDMADFLEQLSRKDQYDRASTEQKPSKMPEYFSTHPATDKRVANVDDLAPQYGPPEPPTNLSSKRLDYWTKIDAMIYGESPNEGYTRGTEFIHVPLGFRFKVPDQYKITNTPTRVIAQGPNAGQIVFDIDRAPKDNDTAANAKDYLSAIWAPRINFDRINIITKPPHEIAEAVTVIDNGRTLRLTVYKTDNTYYRFAYSGLKDRPTIKDTDFAYGLTLLTDEEKEQYKPIRIDIDPALETGTTWADYAKTLPSPHTNDWRLLQLLNGVQENKDQKIIQPALKTLVAE